MRAPLTRAAVAGALLLTVGCRTPELAVYNLKQVHHPDGSVKRKGAVHSPWQHLLAEAFRFQGGVAPKFFAGDEQSRIDDPLGVCLGNLRALVHERDEGPGAFGSAVEMVTWLGGDCTYTLTRERCALALEGLGRTAGVRAPLALEDPSAASSSEQVAASIQAIVRATRSEVQGTGAADAIAEACAAADREPLDREGARRLLAACNALLAGGVRGRANLEPLEALRARLEQVCIGLTLSRLLEDPAPRVRAAAVRTWIRLTEGRDPAALERAFQDPDGSVLLEGVRSLAERGAPIPIGTSEEEAADARRRWTGRVASLLGRILDGPLLVASCRAMAKLSGREPDLHPEVWVAWWQDAGSREEPPPAVVP